MYSTTSVPSIAPSTRVALTVRPLSRNSDEFTIVFKSRKLAQERLDFWYGTSRFIDLAEYRRLTNLLSEIPLTA